MTGENLPNPAQCPRTQSKRPTASNPENSLSTYEGLRSIGSAAREAVERMNDTFKLPASWENLGRAGRGLSLDLKDTVAARIFEGVGRSFKPMSPTLSDFRFTALEGLGRFPALERALDGLARFPALDDAFKGVGDALASPELGLANRGSADANPPQDNSGSALAQFLTGPSLARAWALERQVIVIERPCKCCGLQPHTENSPSVSLPIHQEVNDAAIEPDRAPTTVAETQGLAREKKKGGPKSLMDFIDREFERRAAIGPFRRTLKVESENLHKWLARDPEALRTGIELPKATSIANHIREKYPNYKSRNAHE